MRVFLLRHGDAADRAPNGAFDDDARELTAHGIVQLESACSTYARVIGAPRAILHSPLTRARQSAEILRAAIEATIDAPAASEEIDTRQIEELRPNARPSIVVNLLQAEFLEQPRDIVLVGHEPLLGDLLGLLSTGNDRLGIPMRKGMLAAIGFSNPNMLIGRLITLLNQDTAAQLS